MEKSEAVRHQAQKKLVALVLLVAQSASLVLCMRQSRRAEGARYASSSAVVLAELMKLAICFAVLGWQWLTSAAAPSSTPWQVRGKAWLQSLLNGRELLALALVGGLYAVQNNLLYIALTHLPAAIYQVVYQLKVVTTAAFSVALLGKRLSMAQWMSLLLLSVGVAAVQLSLESQILPASSGAEQQQAGHNWSSASLGFLAVLIASCTSGFAGVLFELVLKRSAQSLWERNIQLGVFGTLFSVVYLLFYPNDAGFFDGFSPLVWLIVVLQAAGGLLIAVVVSFTDNIIKAFATSVSILISALVSNFLGDIALGLFFYFGAAIVIIATYMYSEYKPPDNSVLPR